jgi:hypothetical protein
MWCMRCIYGVIILCHDLHVMSKERAIGDALNVTYLLYWLACQLAKPYCIYFTSYELEVVLTRSGGDNQVMMDLVAMILHKKGVQRQTRLRKEFLDAKGYTLSL